MIAIPILPMMGTGVLYNYVESKQRLFALCLERLMGGETFLDRELDLPVVGRSLNVALREVREQTERWLPLPRLSAALEGPLPAEAELVGVVKEPYELVSRARELKDTLAGFTDWR